MQHTVDSLMALAHDYAVRYRVNHAVDEAREALRTALTEELAQPVREQSSEDYVRGFNDGMKEAPTGECWIRVIDEAMVGAHIGVVNMGDDYGTAKEKLNSLICWSVEVDRELNKPAQPVQAPLTDKSIMNIYEDCDEGGGALAFTLGFARAIERAHGIGGDK